MSKIPLAKQCAFPSCDSDGNGPTGLTKREYFAGQAMAAMMQGVESPNETYIVEHSVSIAEALIAELEKRA